MKMRTLLLVSAVVLLVKPEAVSPRQVNLDHLFEQAEKCRESPDKKDYFVDDVSHLAEGPSGCQGKFFCKVHDVFGKDKKLCESNNAVLVRNLEAYFRNKTMDCKKTLKTVTSTGVLIQLSDFLKKTIDCVQKRNIRGGRK